MTVPFRVGLIYKGRRSRVKLTVGKRMWLSDVGVIGFGGMGIGEGRSEAKRH
jgi:hypothetical protein